ncbi:hypothetical protein BCR34DRAFT_596284 [Clohesyomyces aquaticus]|uniref:Uncharacterized protein n=1 Tax=Clohesyomyces aquaticus TaxID=1231657 RepID=A0A1Y2A799_9PLEO|nr:hypothetical protein BCR34DRAFT_596284 [Clohesyomyces aquaticus]
MTGLLETIQQRIQELKKERDTWKSMALEYKHAFERQTEQLREFQEICFATQAALENERMLKHYKRDAPDQDRLHNDDDPDGYRTAMIYTHTRPSSGITLDEVPCQYGNNWDMIDLKSFITDKNGPEYGHALIHINSRVNSDSTLNTDLPQPDTFPATLIQKRTSDLNFLVIKGDLAAALAKIDVFLRGTLTSQERVELLLLKSGVLVGSGTEWLCDALAQCSEALELCDRHPNLRPSYLPKIRFQRGMCYFRLRMFQQALDSFIAVGSVGIPQDRLVEYVNLCNAELGAARALNRRSAFEEQRTFAEGCIPRSKSADRSAKRKRRATQRSLHRASKTFRLPLPSSWVTAK